MFFIIPSIFDDGLYYLMHSGWHLFGGIGVSLILFSLHKFIVTHKLPRKKNTNYNIPQKNDVLKEKELEEKNEHVRMVK